MQYQVFLAGSSNPVYTYKTWQGLRKRLGRLAAETALTGVVVESEGKRIPVRLHRGAGGYGWQTPVGKGIEHDDGLACSGFSITW